MEKAICLLSVVPVRVEPSDKSEMVTQLLFGETCFILQQIQQWVQIQIEYDGYEGWIDEKQIVRLSKNFDSKQVHRTLQIAHAAVFNDVHVPLTLGSVLHNYDGVQAKVDKHKIIYSGNVIEIGGKKNDTILLERIARMYLNAPYMWGGRTPFGIDCSGFTQMIFGMLGYRLKRDAYQQAESGFTLDFVQQAQLGDLAFFANDKDKIIHVGLVLNDAQIIHASGKVRIDKLDHFGIYNLEKKKYSHQLKVIKRLF